MKTLEDYIKGYPKVPVLIVAEYKHNNDRYFVCKEDTKNSYYYMKNKEVLDVKWYPDDIYEELNIRYYNTKDKSIIKEIEKQSSYKYFVSFIKKNTGNIFKY